MKEKQDRSNRFAQLIGLELKANFARVEISQAEVAENLGHSKSGYSRWLNAKPSMPIEAFLNTCELIGVNPVKVIDSAYSRLLKEFSATSPDKFDVSQLSEDARKEMALKNLAEHDMGIAALEDKNKNALIDRGEIDEP